VTTLSVGRKVIIMIYKDSSLLACIDYAFLEVSGGGNVQYELKNIIPVDYTEVFLYLQSIILGIYLEM
jgi:hypothetical protein